MDRRKVNFVKALVWLLLVSLFSSSFRVSPKATQLADRAGNAGRISSMINQDRDVPSEYAFVYDLNHAGLSTIRFEIDTPNYSVEKTNQGKDRFVIPGYQGYGQIGHPELPARMFSVALPPDVKPGSVWVEWDILQAEEISGTFEVGPVSPPVTWVEGQKLTAWGDQAEDIEDGKNVSVYGQNTFFPEQQVELLSENQMRKWKFARLVYRPVQYNPEIGSVQVAERVSIQVHFERGPSDQDVPLSDTIFDSQAQKRFLNYDSASDWYRSGDQGPSSVSSYVIITTNAIESGSSKLSDFIAHKQNQGHSVLTITEDEYGSLTGQAPNGTAEKIRKWLIDHYVSESIEYVLLIGNPDPDDPKSGSDSVGDVPMKMLWPREHASTESHHDEAPSDYFYADLTGNWDLDGDQLFGEYVGDRGTGGVDFANEVLVGRIPVYGTSYTKLDSILQKIIAYENEDPANISWRKSALLPMSFSDSSTDGAYLAEAMQDDYLDAAGYTSWTMYQQGSQCSTANSTFSSDEELHGDTAVRDRWSGANFGIVSWWAHGLISTTSYGYSGCGWGNLFKSDQASALDDDHPSFVFHCSCYNGYPEASDNLGTAILENGGIGTVSSTRVSWYAVGSWSPGTSKADNASLGYYWHKELVVNEQAAADALYQVKSTMGTVWGDMSWMNLFDFNLYGDPTTKITSSLSEPPEIDVAPALFDQTLLSGGSASDLLTLHNTGDGLLSYEVDTNYAYATQEYELPASNDLDRRETDRGDKGEENLLEASGSAQLEAVQAQLADLTGVDILYDVSHGERSTSWYETLIPDLTSRGASLTVSDAPITAALLASYDILWVDEWGGIDWSTEEKNAVSAWVQAGNGLLTHGDEVYAGEELASLFDIQYTAAAGTAGLSGDIEPHFITAGISSVSVPAPLNSLTVSGQAECILDDSDQTAVMCLSTPGDGYVVAVSDDLFTDGNVSSADNRVLGNQTFDWLAGKGLPDWLEILPDSGTVSPGGSEDLAVAFDARDLAPGLYTADIVISNNDPDENPVTVPVTLTVESERAVRADFDGDGDTDISVFRPSNGNWYVLDQGSTSWGLSGDRPVPADYDGDGQTDIAVYRPSNGKWYLQGQTPIRWGTVGDVPLPCDYDGDGVEDIAVYRPSNGSWYIYGQGSASWGFPDDIPVPADYDGDGSCDIAVYRPSNGKWYIYGQGSTSWGFAGDLPVPADYDGDGADEVAVYRPATGKWYVFGMGDTSWGLTGDIPVPGDYDGDGVDEMAVLRESNGRWYVQGMDNQKWYLSGDYPLPARDTNSDGSPHH